MLNENVFSQFEKPQNKNKMKMKIENDQYLNFTSYSLVTKYFDLPNI